MGCRVRVNYELANAIICAAAGVRRSRARNSDAPAGEDRRNGGRRDADGRGHGRGAPPIRKCGVDRRTEPRSVALDLARGPGHGYSDRTKWWKAGCRWPRPRPRRAANSEMWRRPKNGAAKCGAGSGSRTWAWIFRSDEMVEGGMPMAEATAAARRQFGNVASTEERSREVWRWIWLEDLGMDIQIGRNGGRRDADGRGHGRGAPPIRKCGVDRRTEPRSVALDLARGPGHGYSPRAAGAAAESWIQFRGGDRAGARNRREHGALQRGEWCASAAAAVSPPGAVGDAA